MKMWTLGSVSSLESEAAEEEELWIEFRRLEIQSLP